MLACRPIAALPVGTVFHTDLFRAAPPTDTTGAIPAGPGPSSPPACRTTACLPRGRNAGPCSGRHPWVPDPDPISAMADYLVGNHQRTHGADQGERSERGDHDRNRDEDKQYGSPDGPPAKKVVGGTEEERDVPEQIQRRAAAQRHRGHQSEWLTDVVQRRLESEG